MGKSLACTGIVISVFMIGIYFATACQLHDAPCDGTNGLQGDCCGGLHCHKVDPSWAEGRCYYNSVCQPHDAPCVIDHGTQGNCCEGLRCQKNDPSWAEGRCYYNSAK